MLCSIIPSEGQEMLTSSNISSRRRDTFRWYIGKIGYICDYMCLKVEALKIKVSWSLVNKFQEFMYFTPESSRLRKMYTNKMSKESYQV